MTKIPSLSYNAMFKSVFSNNKVMLSKLIESILNYCKKNIDIKDKEIIINNNALPLNNYKSKQVICDYLIKLNDTTELNIEINRSYYPGVVERNMTHSFKLYYEHFNSRGDCKKFKKYNLIQVNFNNFRNPSNKTINMYYMIDVEDINNILSKNLCIINIDIEKCYNLVCNNANKGRITELERISAIMYCKHLKEISYILESVKLDMKDKEKFIDDIEKASQDKDIIRVLKFEDSIDYRFELVEEAAIQKGIDQKSTDVIKTMLKENSTYEFISKVSKKSIDEIKKIEQSMQA